MKLKPLNIGHLTAKIPIIQGGMGVGISLSNLAGAVASNGAIGMLSSAQIGFKDESFKENPIKTNLDALARHISIAKEKANGGIIGVNIMTATHRYEEYVRRAVESKVDIIVSGAGLPVNLPELVKCSKTLIAPIVSSLKAIKVLFNNWERKYERTADFVVVEGPRAGGHLGFKAEDLEIDQDYDNELIKIIEFVMEEEKKYKKNIPVIFAGGVYDYNDICHYINLGCSGVQIATPFVTTQECDAHINYKEAYINAQEEDVCIIKSPVGMPARAIRNEFIKSIENKQPLGSCVQCISKCNRPNIPYCISEKLIQAVNGDVKNGLIFCGGNVHRLKEITTVKDVLQKLTAEI